MKMKRVILLFVLLLVGCATRNEDLYSDTKIQVFLQTTEFGEQGAQNGIISQNGILKNVKNGGVDVKNPTNSAYNLKVDGSEGINGDVQNTKFIDNFAKSANISQNIDNKNITSDNKAYSGQNSDSGTKNSNSATNFPDKNSDGGTYTTRTLADELDIIDDIVFYVFDDKGVQQSRSLFSSREGCSVEISKNGRYNIYVMCNVSDLVDLPVTMSEADIKELTIPHQENYKRLPFAGMTTVEVTSGTTPEIHIMLNCVNSAIKFENSTSTRIDLDKIKVSGLPSKGYLFNTGVKADGVTYDMTSEAVKDEEGNMIVYSFYVPESEAAGVEMEVEATVTGGTSGGSGSGSGSGNTATTVSAMTFAEQLETGKMATAYVGYLESGSLKVGSPDNWGNVGSYDLNGDVKIQVIGGMFNDDGDLRAYSGGTEFSFVITANGGVGELVNTASANWVDIRDNVIVVSKNTTDSQRSTQIAVKVGQNNVGVFNIIQGKAITITPVDGTTLTDGYVRVIGGTGVISNTRKVKYDADPAEMNDIVITPSGDAISNKDGIVINIDRGEKTITATFIETIDASTMIEEGIEVPVTFTDPNGGENARVTFAQRPAKITFTPVRLSNIDFRESDVAATVTTENEQQWSVSGEITEGDGSTASWITKTSPTTTAVSGAKLQMHVEANNNSIGRTAYVRVISSNTISKPLEVVQLPSYGIGSISASECWSSSENTLKAYSVEKTYTFTFTTQTAIPEGTKLSVNCGKGSAADSGIEASAVTKGSGDNTYTFTLTVPASDKDTEEEYTIDVEANGVSIGSFNVRTPVQPKFADTTAEVWGGVKDRQNLKSASYYASDWDLRDFVSSNPKITVAKDVAGKIVVGYAETMKYNDAAQSATITMNLNGGNKVSFDTKQSPVAFNLSQADTLKLKNIAKSGSTVSVVVNTSAGAGSTSWKVAKSTQSWITTSPAVGGTETNASGSPLSVIVTANTGGDRTGQFVLESQNTTSQSFTVTQLGSFAANIEKVIYGSSAAAVFEDNTLKAFSVAYDYTFTLKTTVATTSDRVKVVSKTSGTKVTIKSQPAGSGTTDTFTFVLSVPASTTTDEPLSQFDITVDGNVSGSFNVQQAKKASILVGGKSSYPVIGGLASVNGTFVASVWDIPASGYVTSSNATAHAVSSLSTAGTFSVAFKPTLAYNTTATNATITLKGRDGGDRATATVSQTPVKFTFAPTTYKFGYQSGLSTTVTVTSSNAGTISSGMTATTPSGNWVTTSVSGNVVTLRTTAANATNAARSSTFTVTYKGTTSQAFTVSQDNQYTGTLSCTTSGAVFASNKLSAFSVAKSYTIRLTLNKAAAANTVTATRTSGTLTLNNPSGTASATTHDFTISVPASTATTEPTSTFDIKVGTQKVATLTVQQAKKTSILVSGKGSYSVIGGLASANGTFVASTWDIATANYVTSSNTTAHAVSSLATTGTFKVAFKSTLAYNAAATSATITLKGRDGGNRATATVNQTPVKFTFSPTSYTFEGDANLSTTVTVTTTNAGTISSGMTATTPSGGWATTTVSTNKVTVKTTSENTTGSQRSSTFTVTYKGTTSQTFTIKQEPNYDLSIWAEYNVDAVGKFATSKPSQLTGTRAASHGKFYQWNRKIAWATTGNVSGWNSNGDTGLSWASANDPCPSGYRVPTKDEFVELNNNTTKSNKGGWTSSNYGYLVFTSGSVTREFPAVGYRNYTNGVLGRQGLHGDYWASTQYDGEKGYFLGVDSSSVNPSNYSYKSNGFSVRCVRK